MQQMDIELVTPAGRCDERALALTLSVYVNTCSGARPGHSPPIDGR